MVLSTEMSGMYVPHIFSGLCYLCMYTSRIFRLSGARLNAVVAVGTIAGYMGIIFDGLNGQFFDLELWSCFVSC